MSTMNTNTRLIIREINNVNDVEAALIELGSIDADFSGGNGDDYLWDIAKKRGFETNAEYLAHYVVNHPKTAPKKGVVDYCSRFTKEWAKRDSYYNTLDIDVVKLNGYADDPNIQGIYAFNITATNYN